MADQAETAGEIEWDLPSSGWEDAATLVGSKLGSFAGPDEVSRADIRRRLEVLAWDCPLHFDDEIARAHGYEGVVAPSAMYMAWALPSYWQPGQPRGQELQRRMMPAIPMVINAPGKGAGMIGCDCEVTFHAPVYPGDHICGSSKVLSITPKQTSVGYGAFIVVETTYAKATGETVAIDRLTFYRYEPGEGVDRDEPGRASIASSGEGTSGEGTSIASSGEGTSIASSREGALTARSGEGALTARSGEGALTASSGDEASIATSLGRGSRMPPEQAAAAAYERIAVGEEIPPFDVALTVQRMVMEAGVNRDFAPIHCDREVAQAFGAPDIFVNTPFLQLLYEATVRQWGGLAMRIVSIRLHMHTFNCAGDLLVCRGKVAEKRIEDDRGLVTLDVWTESQRGQTTTGQVVVSSLR